MEKQNAWHHAWSRVDEVSDPEFFVQFLDMTRHAMVRAAHVSPARFFAYLDVRGGHSVLDIGCGTGDLLHPLASLVGREGRVVGCDNSQRMVEEARMRAERSNAQVEFRLADAYQLPFPDSTFDRCMGNAVLQHMEKPAAALHELVRVLKPDGRVVVTEPDWETQVVDAADMAVTRKILNYFSDTIRHGGIGHSLPGLFTNANLVNVEVSALTTVAPSDGGIMAEWLKESATRAAESGAVSIVESEAWLKDLDERILNRRFFSAFTSFRVSGQPVLP